MTQELLLRAILAQFLNNIEGLQALASAKLDEVLATDGKAITAVSEGGRSTSFQVPPNMTPEQTLALLQRALIILQVYTTQQLQTWLLTPPTTETRPRYGRWWMGF
jgi:hypothetical protein